MRWVGDLAAPWSALAGLPCPADQSRCGRTQPLPGAVVTVALRDAQGQAIGWQYGSVLGVHAHDLFESSTAMRALFGAAPRTLDERLDGLC